MPLQPRMWQYLHRVGLALLGVMVALFGAGIVLLAAQSSEGFGVGRFVAAVLGLVLGTAGTWQVYGALSGRVPRWYNELLLCGGVLGSGGRRK